MLLQSEKKIEPDFRLGPEGQMYAELPQNLDHWETLVLPQIDFVFLLKFFYRNEWIKLCNYKDYN